MRAHRVECRDWPTPAHTTIVNSVRGFRAEEHPDHAEFTALQDVPMTGPRTGPGPGDVLVTRGSGWVARLIRLGAASLGKPSDDNHVAVLHHRDAAGTWWAIEGRPDGIGWADAGPYLDDRHTLTNVGQPKSDGQRRQITTAAQDMLGVGYDWRAVLTDALMVAHLEGLTNKRWRNRTVPGHLVCSSLAAHLYGRAGLDRPDDHRPRYTTPADWADFITRHDYAR